jgi:microcystin-dependent protein
MAYTPINWDELTPINLANLNKMDNAIDSNDNKLDNIDSNGDGKVDNADNADNAVNADNAINADYAVNAEFAENADKLSGNTLTQIQDMFYPVGSIYTNAAVSTNPGTLLGFGTWVKFGEGKVLVGQDGTDGDFNALGETGGSKTHTLTENEMPSHTHGYTDRYVNYEAGDVGSGDDKKTAETEDVTDPTGGDAAHNNVQPYITVKMWKRTE